VLQEFAKRPSKRSVGNASHRSLDQPPVRRQDFIVSEFPGENAVESLARLALLVLGASQSLLHRLLGREIAFAATIAPVLVESLTEAVSSAPRSVLFDRRHSQGGQVGLEFAVTNEQVVGRYN
jgi:hypothetical protein